MDAHARRTQPHQGRVRFKTRLNGCFYLRLAPKTGFVSYFYLARTPAVAPPLDNHSAKGKGKGGGFSDLPAFCRVAMTIKPTSDSDIRVEIWLPASNWNKKYEANGNGGWSGAIAPATLAAGLQRGYATAMTDTGHEGGSASFALGHPEKLIDFGYRSVHEMALKGKAIVKAFYGEDPKLSYWNGCSAGG